MIFRSIKVLHCSGMGVIYLKGRHRMDRAWLGSPVLGHWWGFLAYKEVYIISAILGSIGILIVAVDCMKTCAALCMGGKEAAPKKEG